MKYGIKKDGKFVLIDEDLKRLKATLAFRPDLKESDIKEYSDDEAQYPKPVLTPEEVRAQRDAALAASDWVVTKALEAGKEVPEEWKTYRQALRDITMNKNFPDVELPEAPKE